MGNVYSAIISHEHNQKLSLRFSIWDAALPKDPFSDFSEITICVTVQCGGGKISPRSMIN